MVTVRPDMHHNANDDCMLSVVLAERVGFEPTVRLLGVQAISSRPRYGRFGTSPRLFRRFLKKSWMSPLASDSKTPRTTTIR